MIESRFKNLIQELEARNTEFALESKELKLAKDKVQIRAHKLNLFSDISQNEIYIIACNAKIVALIKSGLTLLDKTYDNLINFTFSQFNTKKYLPDFNAFAK